MRFNSSSSVVTAKPAPRRLARSVAIVLSVCTMLALAVSSAPVASAAAAPAGIDLIVTAVGPSTSATGANVVPTATVKNQGTVKTPAGKILDVAFFVEGETVWSDTKTTSLAPGASVTLTANGGENGRNYWVATAGAHTVTASVNSVGRITETNTSNNKLAATITGSTPMSDLVVTSVSPTSAALGANVVPSATVKNQGMLATPAGTILDVAFFVDGTTLWSDTKTTSLAPGASVTLIANGGENGRSSWTATAGNHQLRAQVNSVNRISESSTTNNELTGTITTTVPADHDGSSDHHDDHDGSAGDEERPHRHRGESCVGGDGRPRRPERHGEEPGHRRNAGRHDPRRWVLHRRHDRVVGHQHHVARAGCVGHADCHWWRQRELLDRDCGHPQLTAQVNSFNRISETTTTNNGLTGTITTTVPATTTTTTVPPTTTTPRRLRR